MNKEDTSCAANCSQGIHMHGTSLEEMAASSSSGSDPYSASLLYNLSILKDKVHQVQSLVRISISPEGSQPTAPRDTTICNMGTLIEEIIITASSMMFTCQQMALQSQKHGVIPKDVFSLSNFDSDRVFLAEQGREEEEEQGMYSSETLDQRYGDYVYQEMSQKAENNEGSQGFSSSPKINSDIIELDASDLLAKYTHYCQICGKGFKRDANLRMHMRAHGDEYKTTAALVNPMKNKNIITGGRNGDDGSGELLMAAPKKYSCPEEGCRWNRKHPKFQPLKSMICVKNHYKRSHCPKLYVCKRCNKKQFSVLSDLRTHEKHCGVVKWQCSCGTTFSRKDKLMGHVALFLGHTPVII